MAFAFQSLCGLNRKRLALVPAVLVSLAGCGDDVRPPNTSNPAAPIARPSADTPFLPSADDPPPPPGYTDGSGINQHYPDLSPAMLPDDLERTEAGARNVLLLFTRAIELREYDQAWAMLDRNAQQKWSKAAFNAFFKGLSNITVAAPGGEMEGAAGTTYYNSKADITATGADGRPVHVEAPLVLRRVNDVPGATEEQLRWKIDRVDLVRPH